MTGRRILDSKLMHTTIVTTHGDTTIAYTVASHNIQCRHETIDTDEIRVVVTVLQVLTRYFYLVEFLVLELAEV